MTTTWPSAPAGMRWRELDSLLDLADTVLAPQLSRRAVHQVRWDPARMTRVAFDAADGRTIVLEATEAGATMRSLVEDPALPAMRALIDPRHVMDRVGELLGRPVERCELSVVSYRPGSRCVLRCVAQGPESESNVVDLYIKVLAAGVETSVESHRHLAASLGKALPHLVAVWADVGALVTEAVPGRSASAAMADPATTQVTRAALAATLGELLARVHATPPGPLVRERLHSPEDEIADLGRYLPAAWQADASVAGRLRWVLEDLAAVHPSGSPPLFAHGSFRAGQVVVGPAGLALLDLDSCGLAAPERDLGNALAYLEWQSLTHPGVEAAALSSALMRGYRAAGGRIQGDALAWWHAAALAKIAGRRYRSLDTEHWSAVPALVDAALSVLHSGSTAAPSATGGGVRMSRLLSGLTEHLPPADAATAVSVAESQILRIAPGRRVVERYRLAGAQDPGLELIVKAYAEPWRAEIAYENLRLFATLSDPSLRVGSQTPVGVLADRGVVVCRAAPGRPVSELPTADVAAVAARCAAWLRRVHTCGAGLPRRLDLHRELDNLAVWATQIARADPRLGAAAGTLAAALRTAATNVPTVATSVIHKDLHLDHVIVDDAGWARVIDLDEARLGDPLFDVAHLCVYAEESGLLAAKAAFLEAYGDLEGPAVPERLAFFSSYTLLKITKQQARSSLTEESVRRGLDRLERGTSCLAR